MKESDECLGAINSEGPWIGERIKVVWGGGLRLMTEDDDYISFSRKVGAGGLYT